MTLHFEEELEVRKECDVLVCGGGVAGAAAAVTAARLGKKVVLLEKSIKLGGLATLGLVNYFVAMCDGEGHVLGRGLSTEFCEIAYRYGYNTVPKDYVNFDIPEQTLAQYCAEGKQPPRYVSKFSAEIFSLCLTELCVSLGIDLMFDTILTNVIRSPENPAKITGAVIENKDGRGVILAKQFVDTTGDADLLHRLGVPTAERGNFHSFFAYEVSFASMQQAMEKGDISFIYRDHGGGSASLSGRNQPADVPLYYGTRNSEINRYVITNHRDLLNSIKGDDVFTRDLATMPDMCQFRTTRRIESDYVVTPDDHNRHFADSVCTVADFCYRGQMWEIPYSCLIRTGFPNVITAGRTVGADRYAWDALRVIPPAILSGQAAGAAACLAIDEDRPIYAVDIPALQQELTREGVQIHFDDRFLASFSEEEECTDQR